MTGRKYQVEIGRERSDLVYLRSGVVQGSILAPILFNIYTRELPTLLRDHLDLDSLHYADDAQILLEIITRIEQIEQKISNMFHSLKKWMQRRKLKLNVSKTNKQSAATK